MTAIVRMGEAIAQSGLFGVNSNGAGVVLAMEMFAQKKSPCQIMREYHIVNNRLVDRADSMLAKFVAAGGKFKVGARSSEAASIELTLDNETRNFTFNFHEAQMEPYVYEKDGKTFKKNWASPRGRMQMLWARVCSDGVRTMAPGIVAGVYTSEEINDQLEDRTINLAAPVEAFVTSPAPTVTPVANVAPAPTVATQTAPASDVPALAESGIAPVAPVTVLPPPETLPEEVLTKLGDAISSFAQDAIRWMKEGGGGKVWLAEGDSIAKLTRDRAEKIIAKPEAFKIAVRTWMAKKKALLV